MSRGSQTHHPEAQSLTTGSRAIGQPASEQPHRLTAVDLATGEPPPFGQTPEEIGFERLLNEIISASPNRPTKLKEELVELGVTVFGLSKRRASALREQVIGRLGARAWSDPGRPRRN